MMSPKIKYKNAIRTSTASLCEKRHPAMFKLTALAVLVMSFNCLADSGINPAFLENLNGSEVSDLSAFTKSSDSQAPGKYIVDIYVNNEPVDHKEVRFIADKDNVNPDGSGLIPCLTIEQLKQYGLKVESVPELAKAMAIAKEKGNTTAEETSQDDDSAADQCINFITAVPSSSAAFEFSKQRLNLSFPQAMVSQSVRGYVDPALWDEGINAFLLDYNFTGANSTNKNQGDSSHDSNYYLSLRNGLNLGAWRLRNYSTMTDDNGERDWQNVNTYLQRDIVSLKSQLTLGDGNTNSDVFDSIQFRGAQMASDDQMLPDSMQGFAPVIRGIAKSNAQVTVKQNGYVIYQSYVSPGAFEITDLYSSGDSGDLDVTIKEEDGSEQHFVQPYSAVPILQREGHLKYSITAGQYRSGYGDDKPEFAQVSLIRGFSHGFTLYGGLQGSDKYSSLALGIGKNLGELGAVSVDITQAKTQLPDNVTDSGQSYRFLYAKSFIDSGTDFRLLGYRYSTSGFYTLQESIDLNSDDNDDDDSDDFDRMNHKRSQVEGTVTQNMPEGYGSFYFSASIQDYWGVSGKEQTLQLGYNNSWNGISYGISFNNSYTPGSPADKQISLSVSLPLDKWLSGSWANYSMSHGSDGHVNQQAGIGGQLMNNALTYSVNQGLANQGQGNSGNASLQYKGHRGNSNLGYSYSKDSERWDYGLSGGVVVHSEGITLSQPLGDTMVLLAAPGADNVNASTDTTVFTDSRGYAILPYVTPYRRTTVGLDTTTLGENVDMNESAQDVIPTRGAVVRARFATHVGYRVMMTLTRPGGKAVPFGATAALQEKSSAEDDTNAGMVGDSGVAYLSGLPEKGQLIVQWGNSPDRQCLVNYQLTEQNLHETMPNISGVCQPK